MVIGQEDFGLFFGPDLVYIYQMIFIEENRNVLEVPKIMLDEKFNTYLNFNYMKGSTLKESGRHPG